MLKIENFLNFMKFFKRLRGLYFHPTSEVEVALLERGAQINQRGWPN